MNELLIEDNNMDISLRFFATIGKGNVTLTDETGQIVYSGFIEAKNGDSFTINNFNEFDSDQVYYMNFTNGTEELVLVFPVE